MPTNGDLIHRIVSDPVYRRFDPKASEISRALTSVASRLLRSFAADFKIGVDYSVALRGSHARGDASYHSDIDVVIITHPDFMHYSETFRALLSKISSSVVSVCLYSPYFRSSFVSFSQWLALPALRHIAGDYSFFRYYKLGMMDALKRKSIDDLLFMLETDHLRQDSLLDPKASNATRLKRGVGGLVEAEFVRLIHLWAESQAVTFGPEYIGTYSRALMFRRYLELLKIAGQRSDSSQPRVSLLFTPRTPWFFEPEVSEEIRVRHHECLVHLLSILGERRADA